MDGCKVGVRVGRLIGKNLSKARVYKCRGGCGVNESVEMLEQRDIVKGHAHGVRKKW